MERRFPIDRSYAHLMHLASSRSLFRNLLLVGWSVASAAEPNQWKGLVVDVSTPTDATRILGSPKVDRAGQLEEIAKEKVFDRFAILTIVKARKTDSVRVLRYESIEGFKTVCLGFKEDRLWLIQLTPASGNVIRTAELRGLYPAATFRPVFQDQDYWRQVYVVEQATGEIRPKQFPVTYDLVGVSKGSALVANIENVPSFARAWVQGMGGADPNLPGKVFRLNFLSYSMLPPPPRNATLE